MFILEIRANKRENDSSTEWFVLFVCEFTGQDRMFLARFKGVLLSNTRNKSYKPLANPEQTDHCNRNMVCLCFSITLLVINDINMFPFARRRLSWSTKHKVTQLLDCVSQWIIALLVSSFFLFLMPFIYSLLFLLCLQREALRYSVLQVQYK